MRLLSVLLLQLPAIAAALAQAPAPAAGQAAEAATLSAAPGEARKDSGEKKEKDDWRDTSRYRFPAVASTTEAMQHLAYAMQLREYCANRRIPDVFVREQLKHFGVMTGREENCRTLSDY